MASRATKGREIYRRKARNAPAHSQDRQIEFHCFKLASTGKRNDMMLRWGMKSRQCDKQVRRALKHRIKNVTDLYTMGALLLVQHRLYHRWSARARYHSSGGN
ncbi:hypothetical protein C8R44DRAFT_823637 [Mycena epipterygia]|nr:hypothetical protein C8R44DRAFT_823637 [Mycena epipterygia]